VITWWTNVRFEKSFTPELAALLARSGCVAVSGGLEVASDRLLARMQKGVTVAQVARVTRALTEAGIMVHAYLMYGFPTETAQETIDALELVRGLLRLELADADGWEILVEVAARAGDEPARSALARRRDEERGHARFLHRVLVELTVNDTLGHPVTLPIAP
jgi:hypothetical protein